MTDRVIQLRNREVNFNNSSHVLVRGRRGSLINFIDEETDEVNKSNLDRTHKHNFAFSSTLINANQEEASLLDISVDFDNTSFQDRINKLKVEFLQNSFYIDRALCKQKRKMAEFPTEKAIQCIPEFRGAASELPAFVYQCEFFAKKLPEQGSHEPLIQVVLMKLKGPAASYFKRINAETWEQVKINLGREFGTNVKLEELFQKIETLEQGPTESFQSYKDRALTLKEYVDEYEGNNNVEGRESYALRSLRIHFLGGLKSRNLKNMAKTQKNNTFEELVEYLQEECLDVEQIEDIEKRLQCIHIAEKSRPQRNQVDFENRANQFNDFKPNRQSNQFQRNQQHQQNTYFNRNFMPQRNPNNFNRFDARPTNYNQNRNGYRSNNYEQRGNYHRNNEYAPNRANNYNQNPQFNQSRNHQTENSYRRFNSQPSNERFEQDYRENWNNGSNMGPRQKNAN